MAGQETEVRMDLPSHGASVLPSVTIDSYNLEVEDEDGFIGDKASKGAFWECVDKWRKTLGEMGEDRAKRLASGSWRIFWLMVMPTLRRWCTARLKTSPNSSPRSSVDTCA